jgi:hypothetical protein
VAVTQQDRVLHMLRTAGARGVTNAQFATAYLPRFSARIKELRERGFDITTERLGEGRFRYVLHTTERAGVSHHARDGGPSSLVPAVGSGPVRVPLSARPDPDYSWTIVCETSPGFREAPRWFHERVGHHSQGEFAEVPDARAA